MTDQVLIGLAGLILSVLTYFAGVRRAEMRHAREDRDRQQRHAQEDRELRVDRVVDAYMGFRRSIPPETSGLDGLLRAGIASLMSSDEVRDVINRIVAHGEKHPLGRDHERVFQGVELLRFFKFAADRRIDFLRVEVQDVIRDSDTRR